MFVPDTDTETVLSPKTGSEAVAVNVTTVPAVSEAVFVLTAKLTEGGVNS